MHIKRNYQLYAIAVMHFHISYGEHNGKRIHEKKSFERIGSLGDLAVTRSPRDPRFAGSNPAEIGGFFRT
jgi:hypothetical protein